MSLRPASPVRRRGFTLAEVAVTIALMGMALVYMMQGLNAAKMTAAHTRNLKLSKELALLTLGRVQSGVYEDEIENDRLEGTYAEEGYPEFLFEVVIGEANFLLEVDEYGNFFDNWAHEREQRELDDDDSEQPYEKVRVKVISPVIREELENELVLERWLPWKQMHPDEDDEGGLGDEGDEP